MNRRINTAGYFIMAIMVLYARLVACQEIFIEPGPGLPSLESLGITPAELYNLTVEYITDLESRNDQAHRNKRDDCRGSDQDVPVGGYRNTVACAQYLQQLGTTACTVVKFPAGTVMCTASSYPEPQSVVTGYAVGPGQTASSYCRDVSVGVFWILNNCPAQHCTQHYGCGITGEAAAQGNGDLEVTVT